MSFGGLGQPHAVLVSLHIPKTAFCFLRKLWEILKKSWEVFVTFCFLYEYAGARNCRWGKLYEHVEDIPEELERLSKPQPA